MAHQPPSLAAIESFLNSPSQLEGLPELKIHILRNVTVEPIVPYLRYEALQIGFNAVVQIGEFDAIVQEAMGVGDHLLAADADLILVFQHLGSLSPVFANLFASLGPKEIAREMEFIQKQIELILSGIRRQTKSAICWHTFESPVYPPLGLLENQAEQGQTLAIDKLNTFLRDTLKGIGGAYPINIDACVRRLGEDRFYDNRYWHLARCPYSRQALQIIAQENIRLLRALKGKVKKVLVLDCDNTLWGGIIGEDGLDNIKLGKMYPGSCYKEFQEAALNLYHRGVVLALCSKNNAEDVWQVFRNHPDMVLKEEHIATASINWDDKASNLRQIASELNLGLESLVFIDDSEFEANLVRESLPEVDVICLAGRSPVEYQRILKSCGLFDNLTMSVEDKYRGQMYKAEVERKNLQKKGLGLEEYLSSLEMKLEIHRADTYAYPRISQLSQRTNQFNLTTKRYSEDDIRSLAESEESDVFYAKLSDRFGDLGIIGVLILNYHQENLEIDTFLFSCRALGRGAETAFFSKVLEYCKDRGYSRIIGRYQKTPKNSQVKDFYPKYGFKTLEEDENSGVYSLNLDQSINLDSRFWGTVLFSR